MATLSRTQAESPRHKPLVLLSAFEVLHGAVEDLVLPGPHACKRQVHFDVGNQAEAI